MGLIISVGFISYDTSFLQARKIVVTVLKSRDPHHETLQVPNPFAEMVESVQCILGYIRSKLKQPFLLQVKADVLWSTYTK